MSGDVRIVTFDPAYAKAFADLNYQWIEKHFAIEEHDREMLDHPFEHVIEPGGEIFFALAGREAVGTAALIAEEDGTFGLAKMAVAPKYSGRGIGDLLIAECIRFARDDGSRGIYLLSNRSLTPAIELYRKHGFVETPLDAGSPYERANIRMELALNNGKL